MNRTLPTASFCRPRSFAEFTSSLRGRVGYRSGTATLTPTMIHGCTAAVRAGLVLLVSDRSGVTANKALHRIENGDGIRIDVVHVADAGEKPRVSKDGSALLAMRSVAPVYSSGKLRLENAHAQGPPLFRDFCRSISAARAQSPPPNWRSRRRERLAPPGGSRRTDRGAKHTKAANSTGVSDLGVHRVVRCQ